ncbi:MAG: helix-turn-helix transcriptional regulator [Campylobacterales bacterium]|nr:helix-turn-helix transcriptional regulator [Campylobacterales bacterium]
MKEFANAEVDEIARFHHKISTNIKKIRKAKGVSQLDVAQTIGMTSVTFYTNAENMKQGKHFNIEHIYKIAKYLEVDVKELFD